MPWSISGDWESDAGRVDDERARDILGARLGFSGSFASLTNHKLGTAAAVWRDLLDSLVAALPDEVLTEQALSTMDLRPVLAPILATEKSADERGEGWEYNGVEFSKKAQLLAARAFINHNTKIREQLEVQMSEAGFTPEQISTYTNELIDEWRSNRTRISMAPAVEGTLVTDPETGEVATVGANETTNEFATLINDILGGGSGDVTATFMTDRDREWLFQQSSSPNEAIDKYVAELQYRQDIAAETGQTVPADTLSIDFGDVAPNARHAPSRPDTGTLAGIEGASTGYGRSYRLTEALKLPFDMTRQQIRALHDKMKAAGLYGQANGEPTVVGDPTDPKFKQAYRLLISQAVQMGRSVSDVLAEQMLAMEDINNELNPVRTRLTDPARLRMSADSLSQEILGRSATRQERAQLVDLIHGWQREEAETVAGTGADEDLELVDVDWEARMAEAIEQQNPAEAGAKDLANQFDTFRSMIGGR